MTRSSFTCMDSGISPISSRKSYPCLPPNVFAAFFHRKRACAQTALIPAIAFRSGSRSLPPHTGQNGGYCLVRMSLAPPPASAGFTRHKHCGPEARLPKPAPAPAGMGSCPNDIARVHALRHFDVYGWRNPCRRLAWSSARSRASLRASKASGFVR